jgi:integrase
MYTEWLRRKRVAQPDDSRSVSPNEEPLDEYRLAKDPALLIDYTIYKIVKMAQGGSPSRGVGVNYETIRDRILSTGPARTLSVVAEQVKQEEAEDPYALDKHLTCMVERGFLRREPTIEQLRNSGDPTLARIGLDYRADPSIFSYFLNARTQKIGSERASTVASRLVALVSFWNYLTEKMGENTPGYEAPIRFNIWAPFLKEAANQSTSQKRASRERKTPDDRILDAILATTGEWTLQDARDRALLLMMRDMGPRADEVAKLKRYDVEWSDTPFVTIHGKGGKDRRLPIPKETYDALLLLWRKLEDLAASDVREEGDAVPRARILLEDDAPLFPSVSRWGCNSGRYTEKGRNPKQPISRQAIAMMLRRRAVTAGIDPTSDDFKRVHAHGFRHLFAHRAKAAGMPMPDIQAVLGHTSLATTGIYLEQHDASRLNIDQWIRPVAPIQQQSPQTPQTLPQYPLPQPQYPVPGSVQPYPGGPQRPISPPRPVAPAPPPRPVSPPAQVAPREPVRPVVKTIPRPEVREEIRAKPLPRQEPVVIREPEPEPEPDWEEERRKLLEKSARQRRAPVVIEQAPSPPRGGYVAPETPLGEEPVPGEGIVAVGELPEPSKFPGAPKPNYAYVNWGDERDRTWLQKNSRYVGDQITQVFVGKDSRLPWYTGPTGNLKPELPVMSPTQAIGEQGLYGNVRDELGAIWVEWAHGNSPNAPNDTGFTAAIALLDWVDTALDVSADVKDVVSARNLGWVDFDTEAPLERVEKPVKREGVVEVELFEEPTAVRSHRDDKVVDWFVANGNQMRYKGHEAETVARAAARAVIDDVRMPLPEWYASVDPVASLPLEERTELMDWLLALSGQSPVDKTPRYGGASRAQLAELLAMFCGHDVLISEGKAAEKKGEAVDWNDIKRSAAAYVEQIRSRVKQYTAGRIADFDYAAEAKRVAAARAKAKVEAGLEKDEPESSKKSAKQDEKVATRNREQYMKLLAKLFGQDVLADDILSLAALCGKGPLRPFAQLFRFDKKTATIQHTREFELQFARETQTHSECVARRVARALWEMRKNAPTELVAAQAALDTMIVGGIETKIEDAERDYAFAQEQQLPAEDVLMRRRYAEELTAQLKDAKTAVRDAKGKLRKLDRTDELTAWTRAMRLYRIPCPPPMESELRERVEAVAAKDKRPFGIDEPMPLWATWQAHIDRVKELATPGRMEVGQELFEEFEGAGLFGGKEEAREAVIGAEKTRMFGKEGEAGAGHVEFMGGQKKAEPKPEEAPGEVRRIQVGAGGVKVGQVIPPEEPKRTVWGEGEPGEVAPLARRPPKAIKMGGEGLWEEESYKQNPPATYKPNGRIFRLIPNPVDMLFAIKSR